MSDPILPRGGPLAGAARRPVAVLMVVLAIVVFGVVSYSRLDVALLPDLNYPTITVRTEYPGAGPRDVDERITDILEKRLATTGGLVSMTSVSRSNFSDITLEFRWDADMTAVRGDIDAKIAAATLPQEAKRPLILPYDPNLDPILRIAVYGKQGGDADLALARRLAEEEIEKEIKKLDGVAAAKIRGGREREIAVYLDESALRRSGIRLSEVADALQGANRNEAAGLINEGMIEYIVRSVNELRTVEQIEDLVVRRINNVAIRVRELGRVEETFKEREMAAYFDGKEAVLVEVYKKADANLVAVAAAVRDRISGKVAAPKSSEGGGRRRGRGRGRPQSSGIASTQNLETSLKPWVSMRVLTDQSRFIEGAIDEVRDTAILGGLLAIFVLYLFLRDGLVTLIAATVISICIAATFAPMFLAGVSLNIMSLGGLALGVGMLVDNAIVVLESSARRRAQGEGAMDAAIHGVSDVAGAITASTLTSVCVFFPIVFVEEAGIAGQIFRDLALTVVFSLLVSLVVALFVIPTCLATLPSLGPKAGATGRTRRFGWAGRLIGQSTVLSWARLRRRGLLGKIWGGLWWFVFVWFALLGRLIAFQWFLVTLLVGGVFRVLAWMTRGIMWPAARAFQHVYSALERAYVPFLRGCLRARGVVVALALGALVFAGWRGSTLSPDLIPESLTGEFEMKVSFVPGTPLESTARRVRRAEERIRALPSVEWTATTVGVEADADRAADEGEHTATITVHLTHATQMAGTERDVQREVEAILRRQPDAQSQLLPSSLFRFALPLKLVFFGGGETDLGRISRAAEQTAMIVRDFPGVTSVRVGHGRGAREVRLKFDRDALFRFGLTAEEVATRVQGKLTGRVPTSLVEGSARTDVRVRIAADDRASVRDLKELDVADPGSGSLPLRMVLDGEPVVAEGPGEVRRVGGRHAATIEADYEGLQLDRVAREAAAAAAPIAKRFGVDVQVLGRSEEAQRSSRALLFAMLLAIFLVYAVMAAQFESLIQPLLIMVALPLAGVGAVLLLDLLNLPLSVVVLLGSILLVGIAVNNAIVLLDCMNRRMREGSSRHEAILGAAQERLRPILMTTLTTILGLVPLTGVLAGIPGADTLPLGLGGGEAAELRAPMAITVIGGLISSTVLTLVVVPVLYDLAGGRRKPA